MLNTIHEYFRNSSLLTGTILNSVPAKFVLFKLLFVNNYLFKGLLASHEDKAMVGCFFDAHEIAAVQ